MPSFPNRGVPAALLAALLFGASTPAAKALLGTVDPLLMAGLLYLGSGIGLALYRWIARDSSINLAAAQWKWLAAATAIGGVIAPALLMWGMARISGSEASLLLNLEGVFTALLAWFVFKENFDRRIAFGMALIVAGAMALSWTRLALDLAGTLAVCGACLAWGVDNNLTRKAALGNANFIAMAKGLAAGATNVALALAGGASVPGPDVVLLAGAIGFLGYGISLALFVVGMRELGTARAAAYFSTAPFVGALMSMLFLGDPLTVNLAAAGALMAAGVWLHLTERHSHAHTHQSQVHEHEHSHEDGHHDHRHDGPVPPGVRHTHAHRHDGVTHSHPHFPDEHHRHSH